MATPYRLFPSLPARLSQYHQLVKLVHHCQHNLLVSFHDAPLLLAEHADEAVRRILCSNDVKPGGFCAQDTLRYVSRKPPRQREGPSRAARVWIRSHTTARLRFPRHRF